MTKDEKKFENLAEKLPCLSCIIRVTCFQPDRDVTKESLVERSCDELEKWRDEELSFFRILTFDERLIILNKIIDREKERRIHVI